MLLAREPGELYAKLFKSNSSCIWMNVPTIIHFLHSSYWMDLKYLNWGSLTKYKKKNKKPIPRKMLSQKGFYLTGIQLMAVSIHQNLCGVVNYNTIILLSSLTSHYLILWVILFFYSVFGVVYLTLATREVHYIRIRLRTYKT